MSVSVPARVARVLAPGVLVVALLWEVLAGADVLRGRDLLPQFYPRCGPIGEALVSLDVPRWNPWSFHGQPWFGPRGGGVLYPGYVLFGLLAPGLAMALFVGLHLLLAVEGARRLVRRDVVPLAALGAGLAYGLGGFCTSQYWAVQYLATAALLPWGALAGRGLSGARPLRALALLAATVSLAHLLGEPQGALTLALVGAAAALLEPLAGGARARALRAFLLAGIAVALGTLAAGPQLLSTLAELPHTNRAATGWSDVRYQVGPATLALDLVARGSLGEHAIAQGGYWGFAFWPASDAAGRSEGDLPWCSVSVGALGLVACVAGLGGLRPPASGRVTRWLAVGLLVAGAALAITGVSTLLGLRFPAKWLVLVALGLSIAVGLGLDRLARGEGLTPARCAAAALLTLCAVGGLALSVGGPELDAWLQARTRVTIDASAARVATGAALWRGAVAAALSLALVEARARGRLGPRRFALLALAVLGLDLLTAARPAIERGPRALLEAAPLVATVHAAAGPPRGAPPRFDSSIAVTAWIAQRAGARPLEYDQVYRDALGPNCAFPHRVRLVRSFESVTPAGHARLVDHPRLIEALPDALLFLALLDAELVLLPAPEAERARARGLAEVLGRVPLPGTAPAVLVRNLACPPWAYLVPTARPASSLDGAVDALLDVRRRPREVAVLGPEGADLASSPGASSGALPGTHDRGHDEHVGVERFDAEAIDLRVRAPTAAWLVVRESWSPDWTATLDGAPAVQARADALFRAVRVPAGEHVVAWRYAPGWWAPGLVLLVLGWTAIAALGLGRWR